MIKLVQYPQGDSSEALRNKIVELQNTAWPPDEGEENTVWPAYMNTYVCSFVLLDHDIAIGHLAIAKKSMCHKGQIYEAFGLCEVVVDPAYKKKGYGLQLLNIAASFIAEHKPDISIFTCEPKLIPFYEKGGWAHMKSSCLVGGTHEKPFRSDSLGLATMMRFYSDKAKNNKGVFDNTDIVLELGDMRLW